MHARDALDFSFGREALVEALDTKGLHLLTPGAESVLPALEAAVRGLSVLSCEVGAHADHRLEGHGLGDHVVGVTPGLAPDALGRLEEIANHAVVAGHFLAAAAGDLDPAPVAVHPAVQLVEQLRLQNPLVLLTASAEPVDAVAQGAVALAVETPDQPRGKLAVGLRPGHAFVQVHQVALVDS